MKISNLVSVSNTEEIFYLIWDALVGSSLAKRNDANRKLTELYKQVSTQNSLVEDKLHLSVNLNFTEEYKEGEATTSYVLRMVKENKIDIILK